MHLAGATVPGGYYLDRDELDLLAVSGRTATLPGPAGHRYVRIPLWVVITLAPLLGAIFVVVMPLLRLFLVARKLRPSFLAAKARGAELVAAAKPKARQDRGGGKRKADRGAGADE